MSDLVKRVAALSVEKLELLERQLMQKRTGVRRTLATPSSSSNLSIDGSSSVESNHPSNASSDLAESTFVSARDEVGGGEQSSVSGASFEAGGHLPPAPQLAPQEASDNLSDNGHRPRAAVESLVNLAELSDAEVDFLLQDMLRETEEGDLHRLVSEKLQLATDQSNPQPVHIQSDAEDLLGKLDQLSDHDVDSLLTQLLATEEN